MASDESTTGAARRSGFFGSLKALLATFLDLLQTRLDLAVTELEEEQERLRHIALFAAMALLCANLGVIFLTLLVVAIFWETHPLVILGGFAALYLALSFVAYLILRKKMLERPKLLSATVAELGKDRDHLRRYPQ